MTKRHVTLSGLAFYAHHGAYAHEKAVGQPFFVDLTVAYDFSQAAQTDRLKDALDYRRLYREVQAVVEGESVRLIEKLAEGIGRRLFEAFPQVTFVRVAIKKPWAPLGGLSSYAEAVFEGDRD